MQSVSGHRGGSVKIQFSGGQCWTQQLLCLCQKLFPQRNGSSAGLSQRTFQKVLLRERHRADRCNTPLAMLCFSLHQPAQLHRVAAIMQSRIRQTDVLGWLHNDCLALLLPNTNSVQVWTLLHSLQQHLRSQLDPQLVEQQIIYRAMIYPFAENAAEPHNAPPFKAWQRVPSPNSGTDNP